MKLQKYLRKESCIFIVILHNWCYIHTYIRTYIRIYIHTHTYIHTYILDSKLSFRDHITYTTEKCSKLIFALTRSAKLTWGLGCVALKIIYTGAKLPLLLYGAPVWVNAILKKQATNKKLSGFKAN
jgi:hypothetical protein